MKTNKAFNKGWLILVQLLLLSLVEVYAAIQIYTLQDKMGSITKPLLLCFIILVVIVLLLVRQWINWIKSYKEYRKGV